MSKNYVVKHKKSYVKTKSKSKSRSKAKKPVFKVVKNVGRRCVQVLANGKWRFRKNTVCGKK